MGKRKLGELVKQGAGKLNIDGMRFVCDLHRVKTPTGGVGYRVYCRKEKAAEAKRKRTVRLVIPPIMLGDSRKAVSGTFAKLLKCVYPDKTGGYAYEGEFLPTGKQMDLPEGAIIVIFSGTGSWRHPETTIRFYRVSKECKGNLCFLKEFDYRTEGLDARDYAMSLVGPCG